MPPIRRGVVKNITLDNEAAEILAHLAGHKKAYGQLVSTLLRQEEHRRIEARRLRERLAATVEEVLTAT